jgi:hypothetical protein
MVHQRLLQMLYHLLFISALVLTLLELLSYLDDIVVLAIQGRLDLYFLKVESILVRLNNRDFLAECIVPFIFFL